jgi:hypothetical protein
MRGTDPDSESDHNWGYYCNKKIETELNHGSDDGLLAGLLVGTWLEYRGTFALALRLDSF